MAIFVSDTYKNYVMPHRKHIFLTESDIAMEAMCVYPSSKYVLPQWIFFAFLCAISTDRYSKSIIRSEQFKCQPHHMI